MRLVLVSLGVLMTLSPAWLANALDPRLDVGGFREEDRGVAEEIAGYDVAERHAALVAAGQPETLLEIAEIQRGSAEEFAKLVDGMPRAEQEQVWDLVRYPGLVADLARGGAKTDEELERIAQRYPEEIRATIRSEGRQRYATWVEVYALDLEAERSFAGVMAEHPADVRAAFERLRGRPDLMSLLVDNVGVATRIGAAYREDPTRVEARFDGLHQDVVAQRSEQERSWAKEMQDPKAREALQSAAREFADEHGYALDDDTTGANATTTTTRVVHVDHYVNANPYPYWFGYPSWYAYPYWYPATVWTHVGFRFGGGGYVGIGLPSPYFLGWYGNYYGGGLGFGYGLGYPYGYGGYYGGYNNWAYPGRSYWGGGHSAYHHHGGSHYGHSRPRTFDGNRPHQRYDTRGGSLGGNRQQAVQERSTKRPQRQFDSRPNGGHGSQRFHGGSGSPRMGDGRHRPQPGGVGAPGSGLTPGQGGRRGLPSVSSGPSGAYARRDGSGLRGGRHAFQAASAGGFDRSPARTRLERGPRGGGPRSSVAAAPYSLGGGGRGLSGGRRSVDFSGSGHPRGGRGASIGSFGGGGGGRPGAMGLIGGGAPAAVQRGGHSGGFAGGGHRAGGGFSGGGHRGGGGGGFSGGGAHHGGGFHR